MINVTKTYLPPLVEYNNYLQTIWGLNQVTNDGPLVRELEEKLKDYLNIKHILFVSNGTTALQLAIKALDLSGEIITTPFSYVANISSIVWENCNPVFVDIDPKTLCIDADLIEAAVTVNTSAIMATHVYGYACAVEQIEDLARRKSLRIIYDAAHAFGVNYKGESLVKHGDISTLSFHATKIFHTVEGGAVATEDDGLVHRLNYMRNFGHKGREEFWGLGINAKNSEFHAAMGLSILPKVADLIAMRKRVADSYGELLSRKALMRPSVAEGLIYNYAYYPVIFSDEKSLLETVAKMNKKEIYPRRYFFPALNTLNYVKGKKMPVAEDIAKRILCLPIYHDLSDEKIDLICSFLPE